MRSRRDFTDITSAVDISEVYEAASAENSQALRSSLDFQTKVPRLTLSSAPGPGAAELDLLQDRKNIKKGSAERSVSSRDNGRLSLATGSEGGHDVKIPEVLGTGATIKASGKTSSKTVKSAGNKIDRVGDKGALPHKKIRTAESAMPTIEKTKKANAKKDETTTLKPDALEIPGRMPKMRQSQDLSFVPSDAEPLPSTAPSPLLTPSSSTRFGASKSDLAEALVEVVPSSQSDEVSSMSLPRPSDSFEEEQAGLASQSEKSGRSQKNISSTNIVNVPQSKKRQTKAWNDLSCSDPVRFQRVKTNVENDRENNPEIPRSKKQNNAYGSSMVQTANNYNGKADPTQGFHDAVGPSARSAIPSSRDPPVSMTPRPSGHSQPRFPPSSAMLRNASPFSERSENQSLQNVRRLGAGQTKIDAMGAKRADAAIRQALQSLVVNGENRKLKVRGECGTTSRRTQITPFVSSSARKESAAPGGPYTEVCGPAVFKARKDEQLCQGPPSKSTVAKRTDPGARMQETGTLEFELDKKPANAVQRRPKESGLTAVSGIRQAKGSCAYAEAGKSSGRLGQRLTSVDRSSVPSANDQSVNREATGDPEMAITKKFSGHLRESRSLGSVRTKPDIYTAQNSRSFMEYNHLKSGVNKPSPRKDIPAASNPSAVRSDRNLMRAASIGGNSAAASVPLACKHDAPQSPSSSSGKIPPPKLLTECRMNGSEHSLKFSARSKENSDLVKSRETNNKIDSINTRARNNLSPRKCPPTATSGPTGREVRTRIGTSDFGSLTRIRYNPAGAPMSCAVSSVASENRQSSDPRRFMTRTGTNESGSRTAEKCSAVLPGCATAEYMGYRGATPPDYVPTNQPSPLRGATSQRDVSNKDMGVASDIANGSILMNRPRLQSGGSDNALRSSVKKLTSSGISSAVKRPPQSQIIESAADDEFRTRFVGQSQKLGSFGTPRANDKIANYSALEAKRSTLDSRSNRQSLVNQGKKPSPKNAGNASGSNFGLREASLGREHQPSTQDPPPTAACSTLPVADASPITPRPTTKSPPRDNSAPRNAQARRFEKPTAATTFSSPISSAARTLRKQSVISKEPKSKPTPSVSTVASGRYNASFRISDGDPTVKSTTGSFRKPLARNAAGNTAFGGLKDCRESREFPSIATIGGTRTMGESGRAESPGVVSARTNGTNGEAEGNVQRFGYRPVGSPSVKPGVNGPKDADYRKFSMSPLRAGRRLESDTMLSTCSYTTVGRMSPNSRIASDAYSLMMDTEDDWVSHSPSPVARMIVGK